MVVSGHGATNLVTGLATAHMDSIPVIAITGQVRTDAIGSDAFQEADTTGITRPVTKHNYLVKDAKDMAQVMKEAFFIATTGRPGPVLIDVPKNIQQEKVSVDWNVPMNLPGYTGKNKQAQPEQIKQIAAAIKLAKRPLIYPGGGLMA